MSISARTRLDSTVKAWRDRVILPLTEWGYMDNYLFTTELHTSFEYKGGEVFTFNGDWQNATYAPSGVSTDE